MRRMPWTIILFAAGMVSAYGAAPERPPITGLSHIAVYASNPVKSELHAMGKPCCSPFTASDPTY